MSQMRRATSEIFGRSLSDIAPDDSAENSCMPQMPSMGSTASDSMMMPMPPSHCVRLRQKRMPCGALSMSVSTDEPVVVKPDMVS